METASTPEAFAEVAAKLLEPAGKKYGDSSEFFWKKYRSSSAFS